MQAGLFEIRGFDASIQVSIAAPVVKWISSLPSKQLLGVRIPPGAP